MRYIKIPETYLPISDDIIVGEKLNLRIGVNIGGPTLSGFFGVVTEVSGLQTDNLLSKDVSESNFS